MATVIRPCVSERNRYWINKHRQYELKHFCLQYPMWKKLYSDFGDVNIPLSTIDRMPTSNLPGDPTAKRAIMQAYYKEKIDLIENVAFETDRYLSEYIIKGITEGVSYTYLKTKLDIPCSRNAYYDRYRKFFWLLNKARN